MDARSSKIDPFKRPVGLLDVDNTILYLKADTAAETHFTLNDALLDTYLELGIQDLFIFTNMDMNTAVSEHQHLKKNSQTNEKQLPMTRHEIIDALRAKGFIVHAVIIPGDVKYDDGKAGPGSVYRDVYAPQAERLRDGTINSDNCWDDAKFMEAYTTINSSAPNTQDLQVFLINT